MRRERKRREKFGGEQRRGVLGLRPFLGEKRRELNGESGNKRNDGFSAMGEFLMFLTLAIRADFYELQSDS